MKQENHTYGAVCLLKNGHTACVYEARDFNHERFTPGVISASGWSLNFSMTHLRTGISIRTSH